LNAYITWYKLVQGFSTCEIGMHDREMVMAQTTGVVIRLTAADEADVVASKQGGCGSCSSATSCHTSKASKKMTTTAFNPVGAEPGDIVALNVSTSSLLKGMAVIYLLPVLGLLAGAIIGANIKGIVSLTETGGAVLFGGIGLALGFGLVVILSKLMDTKDAYKPVISRIIRKGANGPVIGGPRPQALPGGCPCTHP
jgi:sigma-E factor negative regulatory protein RseC